MTQCFADSACCDWIFLPNLVSADFGWSPTLPYVTVQATATELLPVREAVQLQFGCKQFTLPAPEPTVRYTTNAVRLEPNT